jgi:hypothetical protein
MKTILCFLAMLFITSAAHAQSDSLCFHPVPQKAGVKAEIVEFTETYDRGKIYLSYELTEGKGVMIIKLKEENDHSLIVTPAADSKVVTISPMTSGTKLYIAVFKVSLSSKQSVSDSYFTYDTKEQTLTYFDPGSKK